MISALFLLVVVYLVGCLIQIERCRRHYENTINEPWSIAILNNDWAACKVFSNRADENIDQLGSNVFNPLRWFRRLP